MLTLDLLPDLSLDHLQSKLTRPRGKASLTNFLRKALRLGPVKLALLQEMGRPLPQDAAALASLIKQLEFPASQVGPLDGAISVAGGLAWDAMDDDLMIRSMPGVFAAGEMLDWEAPTGGYLISACLATGRRAGQAAARWITARTPQ